MNQDSDIAEFDKSLIAVSLLREIGQSIAKQGPDSALRFLVESAVTIAEAGGGVLFTPHEKLREMLPLIEHFPKGSERKAWGQGFLQFCYRLYIDGRVRLLEETVLKREIPADGAGFGPSLAFPVYLAGQPIGLFFAFRFPGEEFFSTGNQNFLELLMPFMGTLIENSRLQREMIHKNSRLSLLYEISQKAESIIDLHDIYNSLDEVVRNFTDCDSFSLYFISSDGKTLESRSFLPGMPFPQKITMGEGPIGLAAKELKPQLTFTGEFKSILILPVAVSDKLIGVVSLATRKPYAYRDEDIIGVRILTTQIASIDEMFKNLLRLRGFTESILQAMTSGVLIFDDKGRLTFSNAAMAHVSGHPTPEGWVPETLSVSSRRGGAPLEAAIPFPEKLLKTMTGVFETKNPVENERVLLADFRPPRTLEINGFPFRDEQGLFLGTAFFFKDITQTILLEERLMRADRLSALGALAAGVAHEIRNPLTGMKMIVQLLMSDFPDGDTRREPLGIIQNEIERLERIITNLLGFAKPGKPQAIPLSLPHILNACLLLLENQMSKLGVTLERVFPETLPPLAGDPDQLKQVFLNILTNALQASKAGGNIVVKIETRPSGVVVAISDTGVGIPRERLRVIFDPFVTTKDDGTGLGLSVALRIVEDHGGRIDVESQEGAGTTFSVFLPQRS